MISLVIGRGAGIDKHIPYKQGVAGSSPAAPTEVTGSPASTYTLAGFLRILSSWVTVPVSVP